MQELCAISCAQALDSGALLTPQREPDVGVVLRMLSDVACGLEVGGRVPLRPLSCHRVLPQARQRYKTAEVKN